LELIQASVRNYAFSGSSRKYGQKTGFLCHSHKDRSLALGLQQRLKEEGLDLYIDWQDASMPEEPDRETASRIQAAIKHSDLFLFLATQNSMTSRWCPWEIGYADGTLDINQIAIVTTRDPTGRYHGNEYLQLYRRIDRISPAGSLYWFNRGSTTPYSLQSLA
jgi:hypothetical protein